MEDSVIRWFLQKDGPAVLLANPVLALGHPPALTRGHLAEGDHHGVLLIAPSQHRQVFHLQLAGAVGAQLAFNARPPLGQITALVHEPAGIKRFEFGESARAAGLPPGFQHGLELRAIARQRVGLHPLQGGRDHHRRGSDLNGAQHALQVRIGQHDAAVRGLRCAHELLTGRSMQPDAAAGLPALQVERVGVVDRQGTHAIQVGQVGRVERAGDVVDAQGGALVALDGLFDAGETNGNVEIAQQLQAWCAIGFGGASGRVEVLEQVEARARCVDCDRMAALGGQGQELGWHGAFRRALRQCQQPAARFLAQGRKLRRRGQGLGVRHIAKPAHRACLLAEQVAVHEMGQLKIGVVSHQALGLFQRLPVLRVPDELVDLDQTGFGTAHQRLDLLQLFACEAHGREAGRGRVGRALHRILHLAEGAVDQGDRRGFLEGLGEARGVGGLALVHRQGQQGEHGHGHDGRQRPDSRCHTLSVVGPRLEQLGREAGMASLREPPTDHQEPVDSRTISQRLPVLTRSSVLRLVTFRLSEV